MKRLLTVTAIVLLPLAAVACGDDDSTASTTPPTTAAASTASAPPASFNEADVAFAQQMIPHHQQAVEMADLALDPATGASGPVVALATQIKAAQGPEITLMTGWLDKWGHPTDSTDHGDMSDMSDMSDMMSDDEMAELGKARAADFDRSWMTMMIKHHQGAIDMATTEQSEGQDPSAVELAGKIISAQQAEITQMKAMLTSG